MSFSKILSFDEADNPRKTLIDESDPSVTYIGKCNDNAAATSSAVWQIQRIYTSNGVTTREYGNAGRYNIAWTDRTNSTYYPSGAVTAYTNTYAMRFDGLDGYAVCTNSSEGSYERNQAFSAVCWVKATRASSGCVVGKLDSNGRGWEMGRSSGGSFNVRLTNTTTTNQIDLYSSGEAPPFSLDTWYLFGFTYDGSSARSGLTIYVNGAAVPDFGPVNNLSATILNSSPMRIGANTAGTNYFQGIVDEVATYTKVLSSSEMLAIYNSGNPTDLRSLSYSAGSLQTWVRCGDLVTDEYPVVKDAITDTAYVMTNMSNTDIVTDVP